MKRIDNRGKMEFEAMLFVLVGVAMVAFAVIAYVFIFSGSKEETTDTAPAGQVAAGSVTTETTGTVESAAPAAKSVRKEEPPATAPVKAPVAPLPATVVTGECAPGATERESCNPAGCSRGGMKERACGDDGRWGAWTGCAGCSGSAEKTCLARNGCPGTETGACTDTCEVLNWGACTNDGECREGGTRCYDEHNFQKCTSDSCMWSQVMPCPRGSVCQDGTCVEPVAACAPGKLEHRKCNPNNCPQAGTSTRVCGSDGLWGIWSACAGCGGAECTSTNVARGCSDDCSWQGPIRCTTDEKCSGGACVAAGAELTRREAVGSDGRLDHPLTGKGGKTIGNGAELAEAYARGDLVIFSGSREISVPEKPSSREAVFRSVEVKKLASGLFISIGEDECRKFNGSLRNKYLRIGSAPDAFAAYRGQVFPVAHDYVDGCGECWGKGPCFSPAGFTFASPEGRGDVVKGWTWEVFSSRLVFGTKAGANEIAVDPASGKITGGKDLEVSYHHQ